MKHGMEDLIEQNAEEEERNKQMRKVWKDNAAECVRQEAIETARALYFNAIALFPSKKSLWYEAINLEERVGSKQNQEDLIQRAIQATNQIFFYLKYAKLVWKFRQNVQQTRDVLLQGYKKHPDSEDLILAL